MFNFMNFLRFLILLIYIFPQAIKAQSQSVDHLDCRDYCSSRWKAYQLSLEGDVYLNKYCSNKKINIEGYLIKKGYINNNSLNATAFMSIYCQKQPADDDKSCIQRICPQFSL